jgi:hypothetical protein
MEYQKFSRDRLRAGSHKAFVEFSAESIGHKQNNFACRYFCNCGLAWWTKSDLG